MKVRNFRKSKGKPGSQVMLPDQRAVKQLIGGDPFQRSIGNYAKLTPSGAGAMTTTYPMIEEMARRGTKKIV